jgi:hypothetical protein
VIENRLSAGETAPAQDRRNTRKSSDKQQQGRGLWGMQLYVVEAAIACTCEPNAVEVCKSYQLGGCSGEPVEGGADCAAAVEKAGHRKINNAKPNGAWSEESAVETKWIWPATVIVLPPAKLTMT